MMAENPAISACVKGCCDTCEGHLVGNPVNDQDGVGALITRLDEELLRGCVPTGRHTLITGDSPKTRWKDWEQHLTGNHLKAY